MWRRVSNYVKEHVYVPFFIVLCVHFSVEVLVIYSSSSRCFALTPTLFFLCQVRISTDVTWRDMTWHSRYTHYMQLCLSRMHSECGFISVILFCLCLVCRSEGGLYLSIAQLWSVWCRLTQRSTKPLWPAGRPRVHFPFTCPAILSYFVLSVGSARIWYWLLLVDVYNNSGTSPLVGGHHWDYMKWFDYRGVDPYFTGSFVLL